MSIPIVPPHLASHYLGPRIDDHLSRMHTLSDTAPPCKRFIETHDKIIRDTKYGPDEDLQPLVRKDAKGESVMGETIRSFDLLFFYGEMSNSRLSVEFAELEGGTKGRTQLSKKTMRLVITIDSRKIKSGRDLINTLTHEMCHAYIKQKTCSCYTDDCAALNRASVGVSGHGWLWQKLAKGVELFLIRLYGDVYVDLGRGRSIVKEYRESRFTPEKEYLEALFSEPELVILRMMLE